MARVLILIRHGQVHERYQGVCYGSRDVELSELGKAQSRSLVDELANQALTGIYHSDMLRTRFLAELLAERSGVEALPDTRLRERCFGAWELKNWDEIYAESGAAMDGMLDAPDSFAPAGGETTFALRDRVLAWYAALPARGTFAVVAHGGAIASLLGTLRELPVRQWTELIPACGRYVLHSEESRIEC